MRVQLAGGEDVQERSPGAISVFDLEVPVEPGDLRCAVAFGQVDGFDGEVVEDRGP